MKLLLWVTMETSEHFAGAIAVMNYARKVNLLATLTSMALSTSAQNADRKAVGVLTLSYRTA